MNGGKQTSQEGALAEGGGIIEAISDSRGSFRVTPTSHVP